LGTWAQLIQLVVVVALAAASYALKPKLGRNSNGYGRYGFDALLTKTDPQIPLPDQLGCMVLAGQFALPIAPGSSVW
jgi:hypothetical protein